MYGNREFRGDSGKRRVEFLKKVAVLRTSRLDKYDIPDVRNKVTVIIITVITILSVTSRQKVKNLYKNFCVRLISP